MSSIELINTVQGYDKYIEQHGIDETVINAYCEASKFALLQEKDREYGLQLTAKAKNMINSLVLEQTNGMDIWMLEKYQQDNETDPYSVVNNYYEMLKCESFYNFESFMLYMEKNRPYRKRFYQPRRKTLSIVVSDLQNLEDTNTKFQGVSQPSRTGKALAYDTPVLTRNGWKKHGELTILDEVIGLDGEFKKILAIHNPCKMEYKVTFSDGEEIVCHGNHEWRVHDRNKGNKLVDVETKEMFENCILKDGHRRFTVPTKEIVCGSHRDLWVSPYALGAWLGDGRNQNPDICGAETDYAIVQKILDDGYELAWDTKHSTTGVRYYGFKGLREGLQQYGMCHSRRRTPKYIPSEYLVADEEQRLELLAGLLDTDGSLTKDEHRYHFSTSEEQLRNGFISLVNTFGWRTSVTESKPRVSTSGIVGRKSHWIVSFNPTKHIPCQLERKKLYEFSTPRKVTIEKVEKVDTYVGGNCITVEDEIYCVGKTLKPTHNSTVCIQFLLWIALKRPNSHNAMGGHSGVLAKGFYKELLNMMTTEEYTFQELFFFWHPEYKNKPFPTDKSADDLTITLGDPDRFATITCRGIDGTWTGAVDVSKDGYLYVDDLIRDREHSLSPNRMENTFQEYLNKMVDRKNDGAKELMVGTLWNVLDPLERIRKQYADNPLFRFRKIPALNENDESNFDYEINGFSTTYYREMRERLDNAEWMAKFQQQPYVREGILFQESELRYFNGILPELDHRIVAIVDVALGGGDSLSMPIGAEYENGDVYIFDWVFNRGSKEITLPIVTGKIIGNEIRQIRFEANQGGDLYCGLVDEMLRTQNYKCSCTHRKAPNKMEKKSKIIAYSGDVKRKFIFLKPGIPSEEQKEQDRLNGVTRYYRSKEYQAAMDEFTTFVTIGDNNFDDAADSITQLEMFIENPTGVRKTVIMSNFW